jgi:hypothetical protein
MTICSEQFANITNLFEKLGNPERFQCQEHQEIIQHLLETYKEGNKGSGFILAKLLDIKPKALSEEGEERDIELLTEFDGKSVAEDVKLREEIESSLLDYRETINPIEYQSGEVVFCGFYAQEIKLDQKIANLFFNIASLQDHAEAKFQLAQQIIKEAGSIEGRTVNEDAIKLLKSAAKKSHPGAMTIVAHEYYRAEAYDEAIDLFQRSSALGDRHAKRQLYSIAENKGAKYEYGLAGEEKKLQLALLEYQGDACEKDRERVREKIKKGKEAAKAEAATLGEAQRQRRQQRQQ